MTAINCDYARANNSTPENTILLLDFFPLSNSSTAFLYLVGGAYKNCNIIRYAVFVQMNKTRFYWQTISIFLLGKKNQTHFSQRCSAVPVATKILVSRGYIFFLLWSRWMHIHIKGDFFCKPLQYSMMFTISQIAWNQFLCLICICWCLRFVYNV